MNGNAIPQPTVRRLSLYLRHLKQLARLGIHKVSSGQLAGGLQLGAAQVRRDLATLGQFGQPGIGYRVEPLIRELHLALGTDRTWNVVLVGVGRLGKALLHHACCTTRDYEESHKGGFEFVAAFDIRKSKIGRRTGGVIVHHVDEMPKVVRDRKAELAIVTVPAAAAAETVARLSEAGIRGILNFAPASVEPQPGVPVNSVDLTAHLEQLSFRVVHAEGRG